MEFPYRIEHTGQNQDPGKVFKGKKMAGHMGDKMRTIQNLEIIKSEQENSLIFIKGSIPGSKNSYVLIQKPSKKISKKTTLEKNNIIVTKVDKKDSQIDSKQTKKDQNIVSKKEKKTENIKK